MKPCNHRVRAVAIVFATLFIGACDSGSPSRTADELAADSALAADLALANRDTLLVDSIGAYREPAALDSQALRDAVAVADTGVKVHTEDAPRTPPSRPAPAPQITQRSPGTKAGQAPPQVTRPARAIATPAPAPKAPRLTGTRACTSPTLDNQSECLRVLLASADARLNRVYRALITEMRRQEGVRGGAKDPPSVQRLRVAQRSWIAYRDAECRRRGKGKEGALWARPRARCLGQFAVRRANELADNFSRLTAR